MYQIGDIIGFKENMNVKNNNGDVKEITTNDEGIMLKDGSILMLNGEAKDGILKFKDVKTEGYNHYNIAELIVKKLDKIFEICVLEGEKEEFISIIEDILLDFI